MPEEAEILDQNLETAEVTEQETPDLESQTDESIVDDSIVDENAEPAPDDEQENTEENVENPEEEIGLSTPPFNKLQKEFPDVFKKYPQIRANFFKAEKYAEYFPTVQEAESAARKVEIFDTVDNQLTQGDFRFLIDTLANANPSGLNRVADEIVPLLQEKNNQLFVRIANPIFKNLIEKGFAVADKHANSSDEAMKSRGNTLKQVFTVLQHFIWGEAGVPQEAPKPTVDPEKEQLKQQLQQQVITRAAGFEESTKTKGYHELKKMVEAGIADPENKLTPFTKNKLTEQIIYDINVKMQQDPKTAKEMQALWINAYRNGFSEQSMLSINRAFLSRAKMIIPRIRQNRLAEALGTATVKAGNGKTMIPSGGGISKNRSAKLTPQDVKAKGLSEADIINFGTK